MVEIPIASYGNPATVRRAGRAGGVHVKTIGTTTDL